MKCYLVQAFNSSTLSFRTVNFLTNEILLIVLSSQSKPEKAIVKARYILSKIHLRNSERAACSYRVIYARGRLLSTKEA